MNIDIANSVAKNTVVQMAQQLVTWASSFLLMLFLPRYLGPVDYGRLYLAMSVSAIFLMLIEFDGRIGVAKRISRYRDEAAQIIVNAVGFRMFFWIISFLGMMTFAFIADYPMTVRILMLIFAIEIFWLGLRTVLWGLFLGNETMNYSTIGNITERVFISAVGITALLLGAHVITMAIIMVTGTFVNFLICVKYSRRLLPVLPKVNWSETRTLIREGFPYLLWTIFGVVYYRIDSVMLSLLTPEAVVGWYGASYKFFDVLAFLPSIYSLSILPVLSRMWGKDDQLLARTTQKSLEFILIAGIPISVMVFTFAPDIIKFFFGLENYAPSIINLKIFSVGLLLIYVDMVLGTTLFACDKQRQWALVAFFAVVLNVSMNFYAIPYTQTHFNNGGIGASIATLATEFFIMGAALKIMPKSILENASVSVSLKAIASGIFLISSIWGMELLSVPRLAQLVAGPVVYVSALLALKTFSHPELTFMKSFLSIEKIKSTFAVSKGANA
jgi:O-antigen/teichoic acid export membrane protein